MKQVDEYAFSGPIIGGFINQHISWRWTWYVQIIWATVELALLVFVVPETYSPVRLIASIHDMLTPSDQVLLKKKAERLRKETGNDRMRAKLELEGKNMIRTVMLSVTVPFSQFNSYVFEELLMLVCVELVASEPMALALNTWTSILLGILYMSVV